MSKILSNFKKIRKYKICVIFLIFLVGIFFLSPISGDDWGNYVEGSFGIRRILGVSLGMYFDWEGRFVSRVLILFLAYHKVLWNIINALVITIGLYLAYKYIKPKRDNQTPYLVLATVLLINPSIFKEVFVWIAGNITYLFPFFGIIAYLYLLERKGKIAKIMLILLSIAIPMFVEHMAFVLTALNLILIVYTWMKDKKINYFYCVLFVLSLGSSFLMLMSPGSAYRKLIENVDFNNLSLFGKIKYNIPNFFLFTFTKNPYLIILMLVTFAIQIKKQLKRKKIRNPLIILIGIVSILISFESLFIKGINPNNLSIILFWSFYFGYLVYSLLKGKKYKKELLLLFLGLLSNIIMLYSPVWGFRTTFSTYMFLSLAFISIIDKNIKIKKPFLNVFKVLLVAMSVLYIILYVNVYNANIERERLIKEDLDKDVIRVEYITEIASTNINAGNEYHEKVFKKYYSIDQDKKLLFLPNNWKWKILYNKE